MGLRLGDELPFMVIVERINPSTTYMLLKMEGLHCLRLPLLTTKLQKEVTLEEKQLTQKKVTQVNFFSLCFFSSEVGLR